MEIDEKALGQQEPDSEPPTLADPPQEEAEGSPEDDSLEDQEPVKVETTPPEAEQTAEEADAAASVEVITPTDGEAQLPTQAQVSPEEGTKQEIPESEQTPVETSHPMEALLEEDFSMQPIKRGDIVEGTIVRITDQDMLIDVGAKMEGLVPGQELERLDPETREALEAGGAVMAFVLTPEDRNGNILLSLARAEEEKDWLEAERYMNEKLPYESAVVGFNKGGLIVSFGQLRGFLPASQVSIDRRRRSSGATPEERWGHMLEEEIIVKVIEVERERNRLILSERAASKESRAARKSALLQDLEVGQISSGRVISLTDFGAFVDLGGADGLVHLSELSWGHVNHPGDVLTVGDQVEVEIISLDRERQRIGLSLKRRQEDPWDVAIRQYEAGQLVQGTVTKLTKFGAFARLVDSPEVEGLIHISELADHRVAHPSDIVSENDILTLRIVRIEPERRRIGLSLKSVDSEAYLDADWQAMVEEINLEDMRGGTAQADDTESPDETQAQADPNGGSQSEVETPDEPDDSQPESDQEVPEEDLE